jgi:dTDP-4-amino-4,6-dideoxygalactose transaminase
MNWQIHLTDLQITEEDVEAVLDCLRGGWLTMGPRTQEFEHRFAQLLGVEHAVAVSSGTAALHLGLAAAGVGPGDEVIVPALTFVAGAAAPRFCGATPVLVDIVGESDLNVDVEAVRRAIGPRTRAVLATHWMGYACAVEELRALCDEHGLLLVEDCAQSVLARTPGGALTGTVGSAGCFSFFSKKQLAVGEGGMVVTADEELAARVRSLRSHTMTSVTWDRHRGHAESYDITGIGFNFRIDEPRAALGISRIDRLAQDIERRRELVRAYRALLQRLPGVRLPWDAAAVQRSSHFGFTVVLSSPGERARLEASLDAAGIQTTWYPAVTKLRDYANHPSQPRAEDVAQRHLVLPLASTYTSEQVEAVVRSLQRALAQAA